MVLATMQPINNAIRNSLRLAKSLLINGPWKDLFDDEDRQSICVTDQGVKMSFVWQREINPDIRIRFQLWELIIFFRVNTAKLRP